MAQRNKLYQPLATQYNVCKKDYISIDLSLIGNRIIIVFICDLYIHLYNIFNLRTTHGSRTAKIPCSDRAPVLLCVVKSHYHQENSSLFQLNHQGKVLRSFALFPQYIICSDITSLVNQMHKRNTFLCFPKNLHFDKTGFSTSLSCA